MHARIREWEAARTAEGTRPLAETLAIRYSTAVVGIERRNAARPYDYMSFSRRAGELWEPFLNAALDAACGPGGQLTPIRPPEFGAAIGVAAQRLRSSLPSPLVEDLDGILSLLAPDSVNLTLDAHVSDGEASYHIDFKNGFGSNEKGNTLRLERVGLAYRGLLGPQHRCLLLVREASGAGGYLERLRASAGWEVYEGAAAYAQLKQLSGHDVGAWIRENVRWQEDLEEGTVAHLETNDLLKYLRW